MTFLDLLAERLPLAIGIAVALSTALSFLIGHFYAKLGVGGSALARGRVAPLPKIEFDPDRAIREPSHDRLGFSTISEKLANAVAASTAAEGLVVGIEGEWGSGKSSVVNLMTTHFDNVPGVSVVRFEPWIVSNRDSMVAMLMADLARKIDELGFRTDFDLSHQLRVYGATASRALSQLAQLGSWGGIPSNIVAEGLQSLADVIDVPAGVPSLGSQRQELARKLRELGHRFIVIVDDVDRLEPSEAVEVTRVVRAVGDLPNIVYLLCYDRVVLAQNLKVAVGIDGSDYLQKIIQVSYRIPRPEEFDLRRWLLEECIALYAIVNEGSVPEGDAADRLADVCDKEGGRLVTPRDVVLTLNALRLIYPSIAKQVDFADLVWLQIIRGTNELLYQWTEEYLAKFALVAEGLGYVDEGEKAELVDRLRPQIEDSSVSESKSAWRLGEIIPGISATFGPDDKLTVLNSLDKTDRAALERNRRLGSPQHYRYYFSFSAPSGSLNDAVLDGVLSAAKQEQALLPLLRSLLNERRPQGGSMYGVLLDRVGRIDPNEIPIPAFQRLVAAIAETVDEDEQRQPRGGAFGMRDSWRSARNSFTSLLSLLSQQERPDVIRETFGQAASIGWLLEGIIGRELFAHGRVGDRSEPESQRLLSSAELDIALEQLLPRLDGADRDKIIAQPDLLSFLYRWGQARGDFAAPRHWIAEHTIADEDLLVVLDRCRGWRATSKGTSYPLKRSDLTNFLDFEDALRRLDAIFKNIQNPPSMRTKAAELIEAAREMDD